jgi:ankyrin repeat protein
MSDSASRSCPCKRVPLSLSSLTAAEFGDLHALVNRQQQKHPRTGTNDGIFSTTAIQTTTPLHLAAQHGHVAATAWLLQYTHYSVHSNEGGATPLHRASFSGAVSTMQLLLKQENFEGGAFVFLLARDTSFGDDMTPLHKAVSGGRYLAVQLLLDELLAQGLLSQGLEIRDSLGRTPRELATEKRQRAEQERKSVARWDTVAGVSADWDKCLQVCMIAGF